METSDFSILGGILILLTSAVIASALFRRINLPTILGYLFVGVIVGPYGLGFIPGGHEIEYLAEFGVVFLMFTIGLEFSVAKLMAMKRLVLGLGGLQVILTTLITLEVCLLFGAEMATALVVGGVVAMSSTAIVIKQLHEQLELNTPHGRNALGILLFQDLAVIAFLILIPSLKEGTGNVYIPLALALVKAGGVMVFILLAGRWVLRPLFNEIASAKSLEIFTLTVLLITLGAAWLTESLGLSMALGAFLAGMMLAETKFRHQIEVEIRPFRDILLGLFFISIGMLLNLHALPHIWLKVIALLATIIIFKTALITLLTRLMGSSTSVALRSGIILAEGGEFGFALLTIAISNQMLDEESSQIILAALFFSMALAPILIRYNRHIAELFSRKSSQFEQAQEHGNIENTAEGLMKHIIICGFGRVGQNIARFLETEGFEFLALDMDPKRVQDAQLAGERVSYGDSTNMSILIAAGLPRARALIISYDDLPATKKILPQVRSAFPELPILVRTRDDAELELLQQLGATEVVPETLEASLMLAFQSLVLMDVPVGRALRLVRKIRKNRYELLHQIFPSHDLEDFEDEVNPDLEQLYVVNLPEGAATVGKTIGELQFLEDNAVRITAIRRSGIRRPNPEPDTLLQAGDVLVLYGTQQHFELVEHLLLEGG